MYRFLNRKLYEQDLTIYPYGLEKLKKTLWFMGPLKDLVWSTFLLFATYF